MLKIAAARSSNRRTADVDIVIAVTRDDYGLRSLGSSD